MKRNYIYFDENELNQPVFRIYNMNHFCDLVLTKKNVLVHPEKWDDPFENYFLNLKIETDSGPASNHSRKNIYGQCWTLNDETDAMWRIYSKDCRGIKVKTTIRKLFETFEQSCQSIQNQFCYIGKVQYHTRSDFNNLVSKFEKTHGWSPTGILEAETFLHKREAFSHEKEIRLISFHWKKNPSSKIFKYECEPNSLFSEIVLDPRLEREEVSTVAEMLSKLGVKEELISQSDLYKIDESEMRTLKLARNSKNA